MSLFLLYPGCFNWRTILLCLSFSKLKRIECRTLSRNEGKFIIVFVIQLISRSFNAAIQLHLSFIQARLVDTFMRFVLLYTRVFSFYRFLLFLQLFFNVFNFLQAGFPISLLFTLVHHFGLPSVCLFLERLLFYNTFEMIAWLVGLIQPFKRDQILLDSLKIVDLLLSE